MYEDNATKEIYSFWRYYMLVAVHLCFTGARLATPAFYLSLPCSVFLEEIILHGACSPSHMADVILRTLMITLFSLPAVAFLGIVLSLPAALVGAIIFLILKKLSFQTQARFTLAGFVAGALLGFAFYHIFNFDASFEDIIELNFPLTFSFTGGWVAFSAYAKIPMTIAAPPKR